MWNCIFLLFLILHINGYPCIVYLQGMRPIGVIACLLVSLVVYLESLNGQNSVTFAPQPIIAPGMHEDSVIFKPLIQI